MSERHLYHHEYAAHIPEVAVALDHLHPGWHTKIDPERLNMSWEDRCIGGHMEIYWVELADQVWESELTTLPSQNAARDCFCYGDEVWIDEIKKRTQVPVGHVLVTA